MSPIADIVDTDVNATEKGYTEWRFGTFVGDKTYGTEQYHASLSDMGIKIGKRYSIVIDTGRYDM